MAYKGVSLDFSQEPGFDGFDVKENEAQINRVNAVAKVRHGFGGLLLAEFGRGRCVVLVHGVTSVVFLADFGVSEAAGESGVIALYLLKLLGL